MKPIGDGDTDDDKADNTDGWILGPMAVLFAMFLHLGLTSVLLSMVKKDWKKLGQPETELQARDNIDEEVAFGTDVDLEEFK